MNNNLNFAFLVLSCDKYSDLWDSFYSLFFKAFDSEDFCIYHGSNLIKYDNDRVINISSGYDENWSSSYLKILKQITHENLFVILEDIFIDGNIDQILLRNCIDLIQRGDIKYIKYFPNPPGDINVSDSTLLKLYQRGAPYRISVCGFWKKAALINLLLEGENPWNFEINGSYRSSYSDGFYVLKNKLFSHKNMVEKGVWINQSKKWAEAKNLPLNYKSRLDMNFFRTIIFYLKIFYFNIIIKINWALRVKIINYLKKLLVSY